MEKKNSTFIYKGVNYLLPFIIITACFALWGFANDITNPMVKAFSKIFRMSVADGTLIQVAFYGGYFAMAFPAAIFISKYTYKSGVIVGLMLYALGALLFFPAFIIGEYFAFLIAYFILTCGLSFLETSCNPYILSMGSPETATRRLNFAQAFNPIGSLAGMYVAMTFIQAKLNPLSTEERSLLPNAEFDIIKNSDLFVLVKPYLFIGIVIIVMLLIILFAKLPKQNEKNENGSSLKSILRIFKIKKYREGVIAQFFYVGAQIMCWTFIIQYGTSIFIHEGMSEQEAEVLSQKLNIIAMIIFCVSRFICTYMLKYIKPGLLLMVLSLAAIILMGFVIGLNNSYGVYSLVAVSACMSLMFPTIYGIALNGMGEDAKFGAAGLIMAILGGSILPPLQANIIDMQEVLNMPAVNVSFIIPLMCFVFIAIFGKRSLSYK